jgi:hypothetical protein
MFYFFIYFSPSVILTYFFQRLCGLELPKNVHKGVIQGSYILWIVKMRRMQWMHFKIPIASITGGAYFFDGLKCEEDCETRDRRCAHCTNTWYARYFCYQKNVASIILGSAKTEQDGSSRTRNCRNDNFIRSSFFRLNPTPPCSFLVRMYMIQKENHKQRRHQCSAQFRGSIQICLLQ